MSQSTSYLPLKRLISNPIAISAAASLSLLCLVIAQGGHHARPVLAASALPPASSALAASSQLPVVVELFTSEGCSSCPPADALLQQLDSAQAAGSQPVIVLSEHVTYWNNLGWRDPFSSAAMTARQNAYGNRFGLSSVYTPQAVVDGSIELIGSDRAKLVHAIDSAAAKPKIPLTLGDARWSGSSVVATVSAGADVPSSTLIAALADDSDQSNVLRGENGGRGLHHVAVVRNLIEVRNLKGAVNQQPVEVKLPAGVTPQQKMRLIVFLADSRNGHILGAAVQTLNR